MSYEQHAQAAKAYLESSKNERIWTVKGQQNEIARANVEATLALAEAIKEAE